MILNTELRDAPYIRTVHCTDPLRKEEVSLGWWHLSFASCRPATDCEQVERNRWVMVSKWNKYMGLLRYSNSCVFLSSSFTYCSFLIYGPSKIGEAEDTIGEAEDTIGEAEENYNPISCINRNAKILY